MAEEVESPRRSAIKAGAALERLERSLTSELTHLIDRVYDRYLKELCEVLIAMHEAEKTDENQPTSVLIHNRTQHLLDYVFVDFEKSLRDELKRQIKEKNKGGTQQNDQEIEVIILRDFGVIGSTQVSVVSF